MAKSKIAIAVLVFTLSPLHNVWGAVLPATSCSSSEISSLVYSALDGDIITVPAGECTWSQGVMINDKEISILGAGIDLTIINDATGTAWKQTPFWIEGSNEKPFRLSGFTMKSAGSLDSNGLIVVRGNSKDWRIDHIKFPNLNSRGIWVGSGTSLTYGVIDHVEFYGTNAINAILVRGDNESSWTRALQLGSKNAVYVEDSIFQFTSGEAGNGAFDCVYGCRAVFRHNYVDTISVGNHGTCTNPGRSAVNLEIYDNEFTTSQSWYIAIGLIRGGTGVFFNNTFAGDYNEIIGLTNYRACWGYGSNCVSPWTDRCDGDSPLDGNEDSTGYPCLDQIGRGPNQELMPMYEWNNTWNGNDVDFKVISNWAGCADPSPHDQIKENRDFYNDLQMPGYTPLPYPHPVVLDHPTPVSPPLRKEATP
ncbi:MAG: hypothetical protein RRA15_09480 [bacterium]|nr:hypothetical protein [bacterium]